MSIPFLGTSGPSDDLETFAYIRNAYPILPEPKIALPFHTQAQPIPDIQQVHTSNVDVAMATTYAGPNKLPFNHFIGSSVKQIHKPGNLSINEDFRMP